MVLLGRLVGVADGKLALAGDLEPNLRRGDESKRDILARIDAFVKVSGLDVPMPSSEPSGQPETPKASLDTLDLAAEGIATVIWATGYEFDFGWIDLPVLDVSGSPIHRCGASPVPGLYFLGLSWLHSAKSSFLFGVGEDAARIAALIDAAQTAQ